MTHMLLYQTSPMLLEKHIFGAGGMYLLHEKKRDCMAEVGSDSVQIKVLFQKEFVVGSHS